MRPKKMTKRCIICNAEYVTRQDRRQTCGGRCSMIWRAEYKKIFAAESYLKKKKAADLKLPISHLLQKNKN